MTAKEVLRKKMRLKLKMQKQSERRTYSRLIQEKLFEQDEFLSSKCIMLYVSRGTKEVETGPIIKKALSMKKHVLLPVTLVRERRLEPVRFKGIRGSLRKSRYGIYEPIVSKSSKKAIDVTQIDLVVVPGLAFDRNNDRLGHGGGYYDRFLKTVPQKTPKIGLGFRFQLLKKVPTTEKDFTLTKVITN